MMSRAFLFLSLLEICLTTPLEFEPLSDAQITHINKVQSLWTAGRNFEPNEFEKVKGLLGVDIEVNKRFNELHPVPVSDVKIRDDLPEQFDSREKWPHCKSIKEIRDQSACASGYALAAAAAMTDRMCIHTKTPVHLSAEDILACCPFCGEGCRGGPSLAPWRYFEIFGVVTGGNYNSSEGCLPYSLPACDHFGIKGKYKPCPHRRFPNPRCLPVCRLGYWRPYPLDKHFGHSVKHFIGEQQIMQELVDNGPVTAGFAVYSDFLGYKSGIYKHVSEELLGYMDAKIIGYGVVNGVKYWTVANSWNDDWGDKGFFKIVRGIDECLIEGYVNSGIPRHIR